MKYLISVTGEDGALDPFINGIYSEKKAMARVIDLLEAGFGDRLYILPVPSDGTIVESKPYPNGMPTDVKCPSNNYGGGAYAV